MKIVQIVSTAGGVIYGLGEDNKVYKWWRTDGKPGWKLDD